MFSDPRAEMILEGVPDNVLKLTRSVGVAEGRLPELKTTDAGPAKHPRVVLVNAWDSIMIMWPQRLIPWLVTTCLENVQKM